VSTTSLKYVVGDLEGPRNLGIAAGTTLVRTSMTRDAIEDDNESRRKDRTTNNLLCVELTSREEDVVNNKRVRAY